MSESSGHGFIRPFVITGGRTELRRSDLRLETLVSAAPGDQATERGFEHRAVLQRCKQPTSIAELASDLELPVGVISVVVDDLLADHVLLVHQRQESVVSISVLERLVDGVRAL
ncbi:DUF742 domain-containing protein [Aquihabitans sp. McL0605]|uniref:DUF742 domain-containing protein n=1 Tax=Aquihabitans sp. McL0605 TaxID=3415671 RepID=UPI003CED429D